MSDENLKTAFMLLDLQNEMVDPKGVSGGAGLAKVVSERNVLENAKSALAAARKRGLPIVHVRLGFSPDYSDSVSRAPRVHRLRDNGACKLGAWGTEFPDAVKPIDGELIVTKKCVNPFFNTVLFTWLARHGIERLVFGGVATNLVVEATARAADDAGYAVAVLEDCCASPNPEWHAFAVEKMLPLFGKVMASSEFIAEK